MIDEAVLEIETPCEDEVINKKKLDFWLLQNLKIMEEISISQPVSWIEVDYGS